MQWEGHQHEEHDAVQDQAAGWVPTWHGSFPFRIVLTGFSDGPVTLEAPQLVEAAGGGKLLHGALLTPSLGSVRRAEMPGSTRGRVLSGGGASCLFRGPGLGGNEGVLRWARLLVLLLSALLADADPDAAAQEHEHIPGEGEDDRCGPCVVSVETPYERHDEEASNDEWQRSHELVPGRHDDSFRGCCCEPWAGRVRLPLGGSKLLHRVSPSSLPGRS